MEKDGLEEFPDIMKSVYRVGKVTLCFSLKTIIRKTKNNNNNILKMIRMLMIGVTAVPFSALYIPLAHL